MNEEMKAMEDMAEALSHHGILGQKWGVRRYQNPDGTLTEAGRARLGKYDKKIASYERKAEKAGYKVRFAITPIGKAISNHNMRKFTKNQSKALSYENAQNRFKKKLTTEYAKNVKKEYYNAAKNIEKKKIISKEEADDYAKYYNANNFIKSYIKDIKTYGESFTNNGEIGKAYVKDFMKRHNITLDDIPSKAISMNKNEIKRNNIKSIKDEIKINNKEKERLMKLPEHERDHELIELIDMENHDLEMELKKYN